MIIMQISNDWFSVFVEKNTFIIFPFDLSIPQFRHLF